MGTISVWHWLLVIGIAALVITPFWRLLKRAGLPPWLAIFSVIPLGAIVLLWVLAFRQESR